MDTAIVQSTLLLTLLLSIGLFFFIRAATKDRTERAQLVSEQDETTLMNQLKEYFRSRSYQVTAVDREKNQVTFEGFVRPSWFLAIFLTLLAAVGLVCLSLVLSFLFSSQSKFLLVLVLLSPLSGLFYWRKAGRIEKVSLKLETIQGEQHSSTKITVIAHRDELAELQRALQLKTDD
ncbi:cofactor assembly of complex C subunit B [Anabaena catenula]|uniref:Cofactor assembly of complex C subunit B n=1 Tax=Anabaena catenula FACHB-362 TaxID=2692877 RepID=A0ABR8J8G2_9NOST|nr:cofactor assembly of complex C subunit B [Anabaena catenula]MBD2694495.1 cofactor assembly of complex C subunit B [Anabaena catenula FACHB-362]